MIKITTISSGRTLPRKVTEAMPTKLKVSFLCQKDEIDRERERGRYVGQKEGEEEETD